MRCCVYVSLYLCKLDWIALDFCGYCFESEGFMSSVAFSKQITVQVFFFDLVVMHLFG